MSERKELYLGSDRSITIAAELDPDDELLVEVDGMEYVFDRYLTIAELTALRDHLDALLKGHDR